MAGNIFEGDRYFTQLANAVVLAANLNGVQDNLKAGLGPHWYTVPIKAGWQQSGSGTWAFSTTETDGGVGLRPCWKWTYSSGADTLLIPIPWAREGMIITAANYVVKGQVAGADDGGILIAYQAHALSSGKPQAVLTTSLIDTDPWDHAGGYAVVSKTGLSIALGAASTYYVQVVTGTGATDVAMLFNLELKVQFHS